MDSSSTLSQQCRRRNDDDRVETVGEKSLLNNRTTRGTSVPGNLGPGWKGLSTHRVGLG